MNMIQMFRTADQPQINFILCQKLQRTVAGLAFDGDPDVGMVPDECFQKRQEGKPA